jgi:SAM-dependent methyltransferase
MTMLQHRPTPAPRRDRALLRPHRGRGLGALTSDARSAASAPPCAPAATACAHAAVVAAGRPARPRVLDAGCGTGALAVEAARRGAEVVAIDLSPTLVQLARERLPVDLAPAAGRLPQRRHARPRAGPFDHVVAMDSLIHYDATDAVRACRAWPSARDLACCSPSRRAPAAGRDACGGPPVPARRPRAVDRAGGRTALQPAAPPPGCALGSRRARSAWPAASTPRRRWSWPAHDRAATHPALRLVKALPAGRSADRLGRASCPLPMPPAPSCRWRACCACRCSRSRWAWPRRCWWARSTA